MTDEEILRYIFKPACFDCKTEAEDLQIAITLNPDLNKILKAMQLAREDEAKYLEGRLAKCDSANDMLKWTIDMQAKREKECEAKLQKAVEDAFNAGRERIKHPDWDFVYADFQEYLTQLKTK